tara:strand:- start:2294 stop:2428 length:135 start_codon:yes stop_codon:yes gene_type:complete
MSKLSPKQRKIARQAMPFDKITGADFKVLRTKKNNKNANGKSKR